MRVNVRQYLKKAALFRNTFLCAAVGDGDAGESSRTPSACPNLSPLLTCAMSYDRFEEFVQLVRRVRHDANNPLTAALGHVQLLLDDPAVTDPEVIDSLKVVEGELRRLTVILRQLNEISA